MRVIAGLAGGRKLKAPKGTATRPTTDRVKESLFGILGARCAGASVLDLFAGSGGLAIEALSRGAAKAVLVEKDQGAAGIARGNIDDLDFAGSAEIRRSDFGKALSLLSGQGCSFDLIFLDPPYEKGLDRAAASEIRRLGLLASGGVIIVEHSSRESFIPAPEDRLRVARVEKYGDTTLTFLLEE